jgi:TFIIF, beta subunit N-terminus
VPDDKPWTEGIPKNYTLNFTQMKPLNEYVFIENERGQAKEIAGKVEHEGTVGPIIDEDYHKVMQKRGRDAVPSPNLVCIAACISNFGP